MTSSRRALVRLIPALAAVALIVPAALAAGGSTPQGRALLPDLDQETPSQLILTKARIGWRLGFRSAVRNVGDGPLIIDGRRPSPSEKIMDAEQVIVRDGAPRSMVPRAGRLRYVRSPDHQHWHLLGFDRYELRRPGSTGAVVKDRKSGFCLGDRYEVTTRELPARAPQPVYQSRCGLERPALMGIREGISVGYGDDYVANLEGQYLPLRHVRAGRYLLVHRANADGRLLESDYGNNASSLLLRLRRRHGAPSIRVLAVCPDSDQCSVSR
jgi:Lysyl oxidase